MCSNLTLGPSAAEPSARIGPFPLGLRRPQELTRSEIKEALVSAPIVYTVGDEISGTRLQRIANTVVVKHGAGVSASEAPTMNFVRQKTTVRLPTVHDYWRETKSRLDIDYDVCYIVMDYVSGAPLASVMEDMAQERWVSLHAQLEGMIGGLQKLRSAVPGPINGGASTATLFTAYGAGPFSSVQQLAGWFDERLNVCHQFGKALDITSFGSDIKDLVMCHMDLHPNNIILDQNDKIWLVDWACAGFYPKYFEFASLGSRADMQGFAAVLRRLLTAEDHLKIARLRKIGFALTTAALCKVGASPPPAPYPNHSREISGEELDSMTKTLIAQVVAPE